jgi:hypothetical protein
MTATIEISDDPMGTLPIWAWLAWMRQVTYQFDSEGVDYHRVEITQVSISDRTVNITYTIRWNDFWSSNYSSLFYKVAGIQGGLLKYVPKQKEGS